MFPSLSIFSERNWRQALFLNLDPLRVLLDSNNAKARKDLKILYIAIIFHSLLLFIYNWSSRGFNGSNEFHGQSPFPGSLTVHLYCFMKFMFAIFGLGRTDAR